MHCKKQKWPRLDELFFDDVRDSHMSLKLSVLDQSVAMSGMNSRRNPLELVPGYEEEEQAISLKEASPLFTTQAARSKN